MSPESRNGWQYDGIRKSGGKKLYSDMAVQACLLARKYFSLGLRQTEGFVQSLLDIVGAKLKAPDYSTLSRRCGNLSLKLAQLRKDGLVIAIDSTGLSLYSASTWHRKKHRSGAKHCNEKWRKLHVAIDVASGMVIAANYSEATKSDCLCLPALLDQIDQPVQAVAADMAYDKRRCRESIYKRNASQLIPPQKNARLSKDRSKLKAFAKIMKERDDAILYMRHNMINGDPNPARVAWKLQAGYHVRSLVEITFSQINAHASDKLTNKTGQNRKTRRCSNASSSINSTTSKHTTA